MIFKYKHIFGYVISNLIHHYLHFQWIDIPFLVMIIELYLLQIYFTLLLLIFLTSAKLDTGIFPYVHLRIIFSLFLSIQHYTEDVVLQVPELCGEHL